MRVKKREHCWSLDISSLWSTKQDSRWPFSLCCLESQSVNFLSSSVKNLLPPDNTKTPISKKSFQFAYFIKNLLCTKTFAKLLRRSFEAIILRKRFLVLPHHMMAVLRDIINGIRFRLKNDLNFFFKQSQSGWAMYNVRFRTALTCKQ